MKPEDILSEKVWGDIKQAFKRGWESEKKRQEGTPKAGTIFEIRGRIFQWTGNQWVESKGTDELGELDFSHSGNVGSKMQKQISDLYKKHQGKTVKGSIPKKAEPKITKTEPKVAPKAEKPKKLTAQDAVRLINDLDGAEKEKFTAEFLKALGAR